MVILLRSTPAAQVFGYRHYDMKDGLPSPIIYGVTEDSDGFIWLATENGLCRFDGTTFKTYTTKDGLPDNSIMTVHADDSGRVYFRPFTYLPYVYHKDRIYKMKVAPANVSEAIDGDYFERLGSIVLLNGRNFIFMMKGDSLMRLSDAIPAVPKTSGFSSGGSEDFFIVSIADSIVYIKKGREVYRALLRGSAQNNLLVRNNGAIFDLKEVGITTKIRSADYFYPRDLIVLKEKDHVTAIDLVKARKSWTIKVPKPTDVHIDSEDNIWIATNGNGLYRIPSTDFRQTEELSEIFSISSMPGGIFVGGNPSKLYRCNIGDRSFKFLEEDLSAHLKKSLNPLSRHRNDNRVMKILSRGDTTYIGTDAFLLRSEGRSKTTFSHIFPIKDIDIVASSLIVCTGRNVVRLNPSTMQAKDTIFYKRATCGIFYNGEFYVGAIGGLIKIDLQTNKITSLHDVHPNLRTRITDIQPGENGDIWISTGSAGIVQFRNDKVVAVINQASGLTSDICTSIFRDGNNLWVGTNKGLNKVDISAATPRIVSYTTANGLASDFVNAVFADDQHVYVGSDQGLTYFYKDIESTKSVCRLHVLQVSQGNHVLPKDSSYTFPFSALNIRIDFTAISFKSAGDNTYYYKLEGLDDNWNTTTNTFVNYATLPSGEYSFMIKAVNKFGVESETKSIRFIITPAWWQTGWFITLAGLAFASLVFFIYRRNINAIKKREQAKRYNEAKFAALEQQALQAQMNPHFIFNCLNSIQSFILDLDVEGANQYLSAFASMIRQTLDISSHPLITVAEEVRYLDTYLQLEKLRFREKFNYRVEIDEEINTFDTWIPGMFLQPYIENSLRHGIQHRSDNEGLIVLSIQPWNRNEIICRITDNGIGRKKGAEMKSRQHIEYQSKGTFINSKRINAINSQFDTNIRVDIEDVLNDEGEVAGTQVSIIIPQLRKP